MDEYLKDLEGDDPDAGACSSQGVVSKKKLKRKKTMRLTSEGADDTQPAEDADAASVAASTPPPAKRGAIQQTQQDIAGAVFACQPYKSIVAPE